MLGMPIDAWVLLFFAVGLGLTLELAFYLARLRRRRAGDTDVTRTG